MKKWNLLLLLIFVCSLHGCGGGYPVKKGKKYKYSNKTYKVFGKKYRTLKTSAGSRQTGIASWYGPKFHGKKAADGSKYNMHKMTAAHKTLPLGSYVKVTNTKNRRSVVVKITDRGPFAKGRIIDLSYKAAKKLDLVSTGTGRVFIRALTRTRS